MGVRERGYTILEDFTDPANPGFFNYEELPLDQPEDRDLAVRTQISFFREGLSTLDRNGELNSGE